MGKTVFMLGRAQKVVLHHTRCSIMRHTSTVQTNHVNVEILSVNDVRNSYRNAYLMKPNTNCSPAEVIRFYIFRGYDIFMCVCCVCVCCVRMCVCRCRELNHGSANFSCSSQ